MDLRDKFVQLGNFPTPLHPSNELSETLNLESVWLKRDDLSGFSWGGNKVRTVEALLGDMAIQNVKSVVLAAGPSSNFAAVMTAGARGRGLSVEQFCYGFEPVEAPSAISISRDLGSVIHFTGNEDRSLMDVLARSRATELTNGGQPAYFVPRGGATAVGSTGFAQAAIELASQLRAKQLKPSRVVIPVGSGGSLSGLIVGRLLARGSWPIVGLSVSRQVNEMRELVASHARRCGSLLGLDMPRSLETLLDGVQIIDVSGDGFGKSTDDELRLAQNIERRCGLLIDPIYNAKALLWLRNNPVQGPTLYWHTGGALGVSDRIRTQISQGRTS